MTQPLRQDKKPFFADQGNEMTFKLSDPFAGDLDSPARISVFCSDRLGAGAISDCENLYGAIKGASMYCGFFCDQNELQPLQAAYEAQCIVSVIPASAFGFDFKPAGHRRH